MPEIAGTVAGDDTLLIVAQADTTGQAVAEHLRQIAGL
jgi:arginine repressor